MTVIVPSPTRSWVVAARRVVARRLIAGGKTTRAVETPRASLSSPETSAERLLEDVRVEGSGEGIADACGVLAPTYHTTHHSMRRML